MRGRKKETGEGEERKKPALFDSPHLLLSSGSLDMALSRANCALKENACTAGYSISDQYSNALWNLFIQVNKIENRWDYFFEVLIDK